MKKAIKIISMPIVAFLLSGCNSVQPTTNTIETYKEQSSIKNEVNQKKTTEKQAFESKVYKSCIQRCDKHPKKVSLYKDGFKNAIEHEPIYGTNNKHILLIKGDQRSGTSEPYIAMLFQDIKWVNRILLSSNAPAEHLLKSLKNVKKDWSKVPNGGIKKYKPYYSKNQGYMRVSLSNRDGITKVMIFVTGKHSVHKVGIILDEKKIDSIIEAIEDIKRKITNKYTPCINKC